MKMYTSYCWLESQGKFYIFLKDMYKKVHKNIIVAKTKLVTIRLSLEKWINNLLYSHTVKNSTAAAGTN